MTRKDYIKLAHELNAKFLPVTTPDALATHAYLMRNLADVLKSDNGRFDRDRFLTAAGVK